MKRSTILTSSILSSLTAAVFLGAGLWMSAQAADDPAPRIKALNDLLAEQWQDQLRKSPEFASILGDFRYNDRLSDISLARTAQDKQDAQAFIVRFEAIDTTGFPEQDRLNKQLMLEQLRDGIKSIDLKLNEMPLDQFNGLHIQLPQLVTVLSFESTKQYEDYLARLHQIPHLLDQLTETLKQGERDKLMPPKFLLEKVAKQCRDIEKAKGAASAFAQPVAKFPEAVPEADRTRLKAAIVKAIDTEVRPAYAKLATFVAKDYAPKGRTGLGMWALPNGDALYRFAINQQTTTDMAPEAIHQLGLAEVKRIEDEQTAIAKQLGFTDLKSIRESMKTNPKLLATSRQQIVDLYSQYIAQMQPKLPELFGLLPKTAVQVEQVEPYREKEASAAAYSQGTPDGSRPGKVFVNTYDFAKRSIAGIETTAYHEGVPGHHMQIAIAQTLPGLPPFRQQGGYTAYVEGWALYAERLGGEVGFYQDPYSRFGHLSGELLRADRLVLDTGVHYKHWTREQMVQWFHDHSSEDEADVQSETDRYIAWPGQALAYKLGQLKILELRAYAKQELGERFDIRAFHDEILDGGALPLNVMDTRVRAWVAKTKAT